MCLALRDGSEQGLDVSIKSVAKLLLKSNKDFSGPTLLLPVFTNKSSLQLTKYVPEAMKGFEPAADEIAIPNVPLPSFHMD